MSHRTEVIVEAVGEITQGSVRREYMTTAGWSPEEQQLFSIPIQSYLRPFSHDPFPNPQASGLVSYLPLLLKPKFLMFHLNNDGTGDVLGQVAL